MSSRKAVVLSSGGIDSTTALAIAKAEGYEIYSLTFDYGQRHVAELDAARRVADFFKVNRHLVVALEDPGGDRGLRGGTRRSGLGPQPRTEGRGVAWLGNRSRR